jgi:hypothetical protein
MEQMVSYRVMFGLDDERRESCFGDEGGKEGGLSVEHMVLRE